MDFFSNAFVTRDVVDSKNMVVKDGIHIREKALSSEDYNFLEEVGRTVDNAARENIKLEGGASGSQSNRKKIFGPNGVVTVGGSGNNRRDRQNNNNNNRNRNHQQQDEGEEDTTAAGLAKKAARDLERLGAEGSGSYRDKQLILQAKKRGTHLIMMAEGLKKRKENHTNWKDKLGKLNWTIEWLFPEIDSTRRILEHRNDDSLTLTTLLSATLAKDENKEIAAKYDTLNQCRLYFVIPLRHANQPALYPLSMGASLQEALKFKKVLECPTILVLGPSTTTSTTSTSVDTLSTTKQDASVSLSSLATTEAEPTTTEATPSTTEVEAIEGVSSSSDIHATDKDEDKPTSTTTTTTTVVHPVHTDHTHPLLEKYTIEEPPTQWPKKPVPAAATATVTATATATTNNHNNKRPNDKTAEGSINKKAKVDSEGMEDIEMSASAAASEGDSDDSDDDSDSSDDDDSSDEDSSDNDDDESLDTSDNQDGGVRGKEKSEGGAGTVIVKDEDATEQDDAELKIGQAILEAFNQDFGGSVADE
ncbi:hypothetical protein BGZ96_011390 [Linnemannia gamsii]|uniref:BCD1 alpha/beta domain-containing protein n=1 Tax=Linnemannia gamsii TaxID=64522 RepID=A0ABQ7JS99_9FUNG|nr:hypothetical protein BGZ96_011390 [Linnemannia gamsii]